MKTISRANNLLLLTTDIIRCSNLSVRFRSDGEPPAAPSPSNGGATTNTNILFTITVVIATVEDVVK